MSTHSEGTMNDRVPTGHIEPTQEAGRAFASRELTGPLVMLNLLGFREVADYSATPELSPSTAITGAQAFQRYLEHAIPFLRDAGGELLFLGAGGEYLIGPSDARWDLVMLVRQGSVADFLSFASNEAYLAGMGHRVAALADSRLLPMAEIERHLATMPG